MRTLITATATAFALLSLMTPPLWASADDPPERGGATWTYPAEADHLLFEARKITGWESVDPTQRGQGARLETPLYKTYRLYGDGRMVIEMSQSVRDDLPKLSPQAIDELLRIVDRLMDLPAAQTVEPPPEHGPFVAVHLDRYISADWQDAVDYLDAVAADPPEVLFSELAALHQWLWRLSGQGIWFSVNPQPPICHERQRAEHGLEDLASTWCDWLMSNHHPARLEEMDSDARERVRERLRQRLRDLPRGLQEHDSQEDEP